MSAEDRLVTGDPVIPIVGCAAHAEAAPIKSETATPKDRRLPAALTCDLPQARGSSELIASSTTPHSVRRVHA